MLAGVWLACGAVTVAAASPTVETKWEVAASPQGAGSELVLTVTVERGWHVNAHDPDRPYLIPTTLEVDHPRDAVVAEIRYPEAMVRTLAFARDTPLRLYEGTFAIRVRLTGERPPRLDARLGYQACNDETCLPPRTVSVPFEAVKDAAK
jgi:thioredoxin:protein disulfide reductase